MMRHRWALWNVQYGHRVDDHVDLVLGEFEFWDLDVLLLQELADYGQRLEQEAARRGYALVWTFGAGPKAQQGILVRDPSLVRSSWIFQAGPGWTASNGDPRGPMWPCAVNYDGVVYVSVHAPVSVKWRRRRPFRIVGPARRIVAYVGHTRRLRRVFRYHPRVVMGGDWNATPDTRGAWTPRWLARKVGATIARPGRNTGHGEIDYALVKGLNVVSVHVTPHTVTPKMPDHFLVIGRTDKRAAA